MGINASGVLNASSTAHLTATSTFGNLIRVEGTGTSTILGRLSISATSTIAGYKVCTQENGVCVGGAFTSSGGFTTLRTTTDLVGIGTSTPAEKLSLNGGVYFDSDIIRISSSSAASLTIKYFSRATTTIPDLIKNAFSFATSTTVTPFLSLDTLNYRVGIGTTSPNTTFSLKGSQYLTGGLGVGNATTTSGILETSGLSYIGGLLKGASTFTFAGSGASTMSGALGIATTTPAERFSINGGVYFDSDIIRYGSSSAPTLNLRYAASATSTLPNLTSAFTFATSTTNTPLLTLSTKSSRYGRVGIGTSSPSALFAIQALNSSNQADNIFYIGSSTINAFVVDNHGNVGIGTSTRSASKARLGITGFGTGTNRLLALADANNNEVLTVRENGNVGIGTTNPVEELVVASGSTEVKLELYNSGASGRRWTLNSNSDGKFFIGDDTASANRVVVDTSGNVGIGTTNPGSRLEVENTGSADDVLLLEDSSGLCEAQPATTGLTWSCSSDIRLKTNIRDASTILSYIAGIPLKDYTVIKTNEEAMGPIAQELQETYPELVREGDDGYLQVSALSSWQVVKAIQELNKKFDDGIASAAQGGLAMTDGGGWSIDSQTGRLTTTYGLLLQASLDLGGNSIENVKAIMSASGSWRIGEDGKLMVEEIETKRLKVEQGVTTRDRTTGEYYCVFVDHGVTRTESGECDSTKVSSP